MLKGLALTPPVIGRIAIGKVVDIPAVSQRLTSR